MSLSGHILIWPFLEWRALNGTEMPLSWVGLWLGRDSGVQLSLNYYATDQGKRWGDRRVTQKELLRNELICLCKYSHVLSSRHKASLLRGPFIWALLGLQLIEIFSPELGVTWQPCSGDPPKGANFSTYKLWQKRTPNKCSWAVCVLTGSRD